METGLRAVSYGKTNNLNWITGVLFLSDRSFYDARKVKQWNKYFAELIIAGIGKSPENLPENVRWHSYEPETGRSNVWNTIAQQVNTDWVLFLEDDEQLRYSSFLDSQRENKNEWTPALITTQSKGVQYQYYQMRLLHTAYASQEKVFKGHELPDSTDFICSHEVEIMSKPIIIERESEPYEEVDIDLELSLQEQPLKLYLIQGKRYLRDNKYVRAAAQFRQLLKKEKLLPFDRLAGVNGLASCLAEQHKWEKALSLCKQSLEAESLQRLPYLIQFRIYELRKEWQKAFDTLKQYYDRLSLYSRASFDRQIDEEKTLVNLANVALKGGERAKATTYFEELFTFKRGNADRKMLEKALMLSIELKNRKRSIYLFERLFGDLLPPNEMDEEYREQIDEAMTMFMKQEWFDYVSGIYNRLHNAYPNDREYKRKLIVTLTKTDRLDQAKKMVANIV